MIELRRNTPNVDWTLENGSYLFSTKGQMGDFGYKSSTTLIPKGTQDCISRQVGRQFMQLLAKNAVLHANNFSMKVGNVPCDVIPSTLTPKHRISIDSRNYDKHGTLIPSVTSFGLKQEFEALFIHKKFLMTLLNFSEIFYKSKHSLNVDLQLILRFDVYDLRQARQPYFTKQISLCRKLCLAERTLLRSRAHELEEQVGGPVRRYKGVRWRPERKHPWVAEIKLPKKKKMWIGDFDTPEAAARAYDAAAIVHGKEKTALNFGEDSTSNSTYHQLSSTNLPSAQSHSITDRTESHSRPSKLHMSYCSPLDNYNAASFGIQNKLLEASQAISTATYLHSPNEEDDRSSMRLHDNWYSINDSPEFIPMDKLMLEGDRELPFFDRIWVDRNMTSPDPKCANQFVEHKYGS